MLSIILLTVSVYLFLMLMGWGVTRLILPLSTRSYQFWLIPWFGLIVANVSAVFFSQLGLGTNQSIYLVSLLGIGLLVLCKLFKIPISISFQRFDGAIAFGTFIALFLALYPLIAVDQFPTTISLGNADPQNYAVLGDYLKTHSINQSPQVLPEQPSTFLIKWLLSPGVRPGSWLVFGLIASLFNLPTYQIFTIAIGVLFALTPALISIFTLIATKRQFPAVVALTLSVFNVNLLFFNYHGFGAQIFGQGCLILAFMLFWLAESGKEPYHYYLLPIGLSISSLFTLYPEISVFFIGPLFLYITLRLAQKDIKKSILIKNIYITFVVTIIINPWSFWNGIQYTLLASELRSGWSLNWIFPAHMAGLLSIHSKQTYPNFLILLVSLLVLSLIALGINRLSNRTFWLSILIFTTFILLWLQLIRDYSYGYYKTIGFVTFAILITFSVGLASIVPQICFNRNYTWQILTVGLIGCINTTAVLTIFQPMLVSHASVDASLVNLSEAAKVAGATKVYIEGDSYWQQMWSSYFLGRTPMAFMNPNIYYRESDIHSDFVPMKVFSIVGEGGLLLTRNWHEEFIDTEERLWNNATYSLVLPDDKTILGGKDIRVRLSKNWWALQRWWGDPSDSQGFRWMNQDATIQIESRELQPLKVTPKIKFVPILPETTVDVYLNERLIKTLQIESQPRFYTISCQLEVGDNQLRFHVREGATQPPGDSRMIALGVNAIRFNWGTVGAK